MLEKSYTAELIDGLKRLFAAHFMIMTGRHWALN